MHKDFSEHKDTQSSGAVRKSMWPSWAPVPNKPTVSVDVKQHFSQQARAAVCHEDVLEDPYRCTVMDMPESREMSERTDWQAKQPPASGLCLARFEVSMSLRRYLRAQCQGHHTSQLLGKREA